MSGDTASSPKSHCDEKRKRRSIVIQRWWHPRAEMVAMTMLRAIAAMFLLACTPAASFAQSEPQQVTIGVLNDMSGTFADQSGPGSLVAARMAIEELGGKVLDKPVKAIGGDHQNKPDVAASLGRPWYDVDGVQLIVDMPNSGTALAVQEVALNG